MEKELETQVLIIGGGIIGAAIARELSRYKVNTIVVEKEVDVGGRQSRGNGGNVYSCAGLRWASSVVVKSVITKADEPLLHPDSIKEQCILKGFARFDSLTKELGVSSFKIVRFMMVALNDDDVKILKESEELSKQIGSAPERLSKEAILAIEPNISDKVVCGLADSKHQGHIYPWEYCMALAENARANGIRIMTGAEVTAIRPLNGGFMVDTDRGPIRTEFIVNAGGIYADRVAQMAGVCDFGLTLLKGQTEILDKRLKGLVNSCIGFPPKPGLGGQIAEFPHGNINLGFLEYFPTKDREDTSRRSDWTSLSFARARMLVPSVSEKDLIKSFTAIRVFNTRDPEDHIVEATKKHPHFINAIIRLPGIAGSPAIAEYVVNILGNQGLELVKKTDFNPYRKGIPKVSELPDEQRQKLIAQDARYGHVVCRCEEVSEGEIVEAIRRGARTVAGVKYRTRAGMGRCQGGFCGPRVVEILARELDIPMTEVTEKGGLSRILLYRSKELLG